MKAAVKFRIYPTEEQASLIARTLGCCRFVYNRGLELKEAAYKERGEKVSINSLIKMLPKWKVKDETAWLAEVDSMALQQSLKNLGRAYDKYFENLKKGRVVSKKRDTDGNLINPYGHPVFHKKEYAGSYRTNQNKDRTSIRVIDEKHIKLPKLGVVKASVSREVMGRITSATVRRTATGKFFVSLQLNEYVPDPMEKGSIDVLGVDVGSRKLMVESDGTVVENNRRLEKKLKALARAQRKLSRRKGSKKGETKSKNYIKQQKRVAAIHEKVANQRRDDLHKATTDAVRKSQAIAVEDLNVKGLMSNRNVARCLGDASPGTVLRMLEYKCEMYGRGFVKVDRFFPSSKLCHFCGYKFDDLGSSEFWVCPSCGAEHDRDFNASVNIADEGRRILNISIGTVGPTGTEAGVESRPTPDGDTGKTALAA